MRVRAEFSEQRVAVSNQIFGVDVGPFLLQFAEPHPPFIEIVAICPLRISNRLDPGAHRALFVEIEEHGLDHGHVVIDEKPKSLQRSGPPNVSVVNDRTNQALGPTWHPRTVPHFES